MDKTSRGTEIKEEDVVFEDTDSYSSKGTSGIKDICLRQFSRCCAELSKEMTRGGVVKRIVEGQLIEIPVPDQIQIVLNSIDTLKIILEAKIKANEKIIGERIKNFNSGLKRLSDDYTSKINKRRKEYPTNTVKRQPYEREILQKQLNDDLYALKEEYEYDLLNQYKKLLTALSLLMDHLNYFEEKGATG